MIQGAHRRSEGLIEVPVDQEAIGDLNGAPGAILATSDRTIQALGTQSIDTLRAAVLADPIWDRLRTGREANSSRRTPTWAAHITRALGDGPAPELDHYFDPVSAALRTIGEAHA